MVVRSDGSSEVVPPHPRTQAWFRIPNGHPPKQSAVRPAVPLQVKEELPDEEDSLEDTSDAGEEDAASESPAAEGDSDIEEDALAEPVTATGDETGDEDSSSEPPLAETRALTETAETAVVLAGGPAGESEGESPEELPEGYDLLDITCFLRKRLPGLSCRHKISAVMPFASMMPFNEAVRRHFAELAAEDLPDFGGERREDEELHEEITRLEQALASQSLSFKLRVEQL
jgi:hypothetical protein